MTAVIILVAIAVVLIVFIIALYNKLVKLRNMVDNAWAQIDVQLQRRLDLIPNVVETVKGYAQHESTTLDAVRLARLWRAQALPRAAWEPTTTLPRLSKACSRWPKPIPT